MKITSYVGTIGAAGTAMPTRWSISKGHRHTEEDLRKAIIDGVGPDG